MAEHTADGRTGWPERLQVYRAQLDCRFPQVGEVFERCLVDALAVLLSLIHI